MLVGCRNCVTDSRVMIRQCQHRILGWKASPCYKYSNWLLMQLGFINRMNKGSIVLMRCIFYGRRTQHFSAHRVTSRTPFLCCSCAHCSTGSSKQVNIWPVRHSLGSLLLLRSHSPSQIRGDKQDVFNRQSLSRSRQCHGMSPHTYTHILASAGSAIAVYRYNIYITTYIE